MDTITPDAMQRAINFAKQDPKSSYAQELQQRIQSGAYNSVLQKMGKDTSGYGTPTAPSDGTQVDTPRIAAARASATQANTAADEAGSLGGTIKQTAIDAGKSLVSNTIKTGENLGQAAAAGEVTASNERDTTGISEMQKKILQQIHLDKTIGKDTSHLESAYNSVTSHGMAQGVNDILPALDKTNTQALMEAAGVGLELTAGDMGLGAAKDIVKGAIKPTVDAAKAGATVIKDTVATAQATKLANAAAKNQSGVVDLLKQDAETMTPTMKKSAVDEGRQLIKNTKLGGTQVDFAPTKEVERASSVLTDPTVMRSPITPKDAPNVVYAKVKTAISQKGAQAEKFLEDNPVYVSNEEHGKIFADMKATAERTSTETEMKAYDEQLNLFQKQLEDQSGKTGTLNTSDYYRALKNYEENVASKMARGKDALLDPTGVASAKVNAASDIRTAIRDMLNARHPEFKDKMDDLMSLYHVKDNTLFNASKIKSQTLFEKHPKVTRALKAGTALTGLGVGGEMIKAAI